MFKYLRLYEVFIDKDTANKKILDKMVTASLSPSYMAAEFFQGFVDFLYEPIENEKNFNEEYMLFGDIILSVHSLKYSFELDILDVYQMLSIDFNIIMHRAEDLYDSNLIEDAGYKEEAARYEDEFEEPAVEEAAELSSKEEYHEEIEKKIKSIFSAGDDLEEYFSFIKRQGGRIISFLDQLEFEVQFNRFLRDKDK